MPLTVITGTFHLVGQTRAGNPSGFEPDGDSVQFKPSKPALLDRLARVGQPYRLTSIGSTQLRFEGIDALELHFEGSHQRRPLADQARDFLTGELELNPVPYRPPDDLRVQPPCPHEAAPGYILSRALEAHGRPVSFAFAGAPKDPDGSEIFVNAALLKKSLNYRSLAAGHAYPLFYDTLFASMRAVLTAAAVSARKAKLGLWKSDRSQSGLAVTNQAGLEKSGVVFPKLFRRLSEYLGDRPTGMAGFLPWLADKREQVLELPSNNFTHFDNAIRRQGNKVSLTLKPEELVFISAKTASPGVAPWLKV